MENPNTRKNIHCKGRNLTTGEPCRKVLLETDGSRLFVKSSDGTEFIIEFGKGTKIVCEKCGYKNQLYK